MVPTYSSRVPWIVVSVVALSLTNGCIQTPTAPSHYAPFSQIDLRQGTGAQVAEGDLVSVNYTGWLFNASAPDQKGAPFDASAPGVPFQFVLGADTVIPGWNRGLPGMRVGGLRRLVIPPSLAYGSKRVGIIPPNATLLFEIELLGVGE
ncbi:MAG: FKBP-type peptidyl-prolyl cis-trans isomerase [Acidobacteria bacterium]|nr:FKBP-type peptidyl-prolyl cis-trans isomerase [Acidobacteriota bacterium]